MSIPNESQPLPSLNALRAFEVVARTGSVTAASRELCVTQGAVSHLVAALEEWAGTPLLRRQGRGVQPTEAGRNLSECATGAFSLLVDGCARLRRGRTSEILVAAPASFLGNWLVPRLGEFEEAHPGVRLLLRTDGSLEELSARRIDALVVCGSPPWPAGIAVSDIAPERIGPVCAPSLARRLGQTWPPSSSRLETLSRPAAWKEWAASAKQKLPKGPVRRFDHLAPLLEAARAGLGFAIAPDLLVEREIRRGELAAPRGFVESPHRFGLAVLADRAEEEPLRDLLGWLPSQASGSRLAAIAAKISGSPRSS